MYKTISFKRKVLTTAIAAVSFSGMAYAQDDSVEEVMVTGIRASVVQAMDTKRNAVGVVDAISSEDIGKMPDTNLAESLQRITGLSIDRSNGEGSRVTVRGIDPSLNMVTLNGRNMPAVSNGSTGDNSTRAFDFSNLASEVVNGVEVYKTGKANITSGGLGAVINIKTLRPLDLGDVKATFGVKAVSDTTVENGAEITPEASGLYSWTNEDGNFGVAVSGAYQERANGRSNAFINNWNLQTAGAPTTTTAGAPLTSDGVLPASASVVNAPAAGTMYNLPSDIRYSLEDNNRVRQNGQLTLQFKPVDSLTGTLDYTYSENELESDRAQQSTWFNISAIDNIEFDNGAVKTPLIYDETYPGGGKDVSFAQESYVGTTVNNSFGFNLAYDVSDDFKLGLDYHSSSAENVSDNRQAGLNANVVTANHAEFNSGLPVIGIEMDDSNPARGNGNGFVDGGDVSGAMGTISHSTQRTEIEQLRLNGSVNLGELAFFSESGLDFGIESRKDENSSLNGDGGAARITMGNWGGVAPSSFGNDWAGYFSPRDFAKGFDDYNSTTGNPKFLHSGVDADLEKVLEKMESMNAQAQTREWYHVGDDPGSTDVETDWGYWVNPALPGANLAAKRDNNVNPTNFNSFPNGKAQWSGVVTTNRLIEEEVNSVYFQFNGAFELAGMDSNFVAGVRYEETDVTSTSTVSEPSILEWQENNDWAVLLKNQAASPSARTGSYDNFLPNLDFDISPTDDVKIRASFSETIGRAGYNELRSDVAINSAYNKTANAGNPSLKPMESTNFDLSTEWYYSEDSYVSAGYFFKDVSNFIGAGTVESDWYGLRDARMGPRFAQAQAAIIAAGGNPNDETLQHNQMLIIDGKNPNDPSTSVYADGTDPLLIWTTNTPVNDVDNTIDGIELAVQHWFGGSGFGVQANYTMVDADKNFNNLVTGGQTAMLGLSDSANLIGFYDRDAWQVRLAYNWRDEFLESRTRSGANEPGYTEEFAQIDFSISYELNDNVTFTAEGLNVTGEDSRIHGRSVNQMYSMEDLGARYQVGARYTF